MQVWVDPLLRKGYMASIVSTALRGSYKFKSAEVATIMVAAGFALGVAGRAFLSLPPDVARPRNWTLC